MQSQSWYPYVASCTQYYPAKIKVKHVKLNICCGSQDTSGYLMFKYIETFDVVDVNLFNSDQWTSCLIWYTKFYISMSFYWRRRVIWHAVRRTIDVHVTVFVCVPSFSTFYTTVEIRKSFTINLSNYCFGAISTYSKVCVSYHLPLVSVLNLNGDS